jgi:hypothetical protein
MAGSVDRLLLELTRVNNSCLPVIRQYFDDLSNEGVKKKIEKEKGALGS